MNMLQPEYPASVESAGGLTEALPSVSETVESILGFFRRQYRVIAFATALAIALGFIYALTSPPNYTAIATMLIDTKKVQMFQQQSMFNDMPIDSSMIESQVEIFKSESIALAVIDHLHLDQDPEFVNPS